MGKRGRVRSVGLTPWVKVALDNWAAAAGVANGRIFRVLNKDGQLAGGVRTKGGRWMDGNLTPQAIYNIAKEHVLAAGYNNREGKPRTAYGGRCQPVERIVVVGDGRYVVCNSSTSRASVGTSPHYLTLWSQPAQHTRYLLAAGRLALWRNAYANRRKQYVTGF